MKWYIVKLVYQVLSSEGKPTSQFDEQLRMINADDELHAFQKARLLGHREQDSLLNGLNKPVLWKFIDVTEVHVLSDMRDGTEITSHISEETDAAVFKKSIYLRAAHLLEDCMMQTIHNN